MSHQDQNGPGRGFEQDPEERPEPLWTRSEDDPGSTGTADTAPRTAHAPSPREQWFGGFEGEAPPPPPYARMPEDTPPGGEEPPAFRGGPVGREEDAEEREPEEKPEDRPAEEYAAEERKPEEHPAERIGETAPDETEPDEAEPTVRLMPGGRKRSLRRPTRPGGPRPGDTDPLGPRRLRSDPDVPEPEQLPPLEPAGAEEPPADESAPAPWAAAPPPVSAPLSRTGPEPLAGPAADPDPRGEPAPDPGPWREPAPDRGSWREPGSDGGPGRSPLPDPSPSSPPTESAPAGGARETSDSLSAATLVRNRHQGPSGGWRKAVHAVTLGLVNPGESPKVLRQRELTARACTPVATGHHRVAVLSLKGGVGKTTTTVALGATLASLRGDRVLAVDANPDRGTLSDKVRLETAATIRDLLNERNLVSRYADIRGFTSQAPSRLEILASDRDPAVSEAFSDEDYREVARIVEHFYSICITDCGTGLLHSAMRGVLGLADQVVLVSSASVDGARSASATLDWLEAHGYGQLVRGAVVVLSMVRSNSKSSVDLNRLEEHFASRCRAVVRVPWDDHLEEGAEVDLAQLAPATRDAYLKLAATVGEFFGRHR
ncbi:AAA family ATPase [Nocardiopsis algeriensis]|uniref:MinD/ParA family ATP-binding protein n=1 Tax=Nocardiopsis algeriensis TaxID=1478215 RepID=UPI003B436F66